MKDCWDLLVDGMWYNLIVLKENSLSAKVRYYINIQSILYFILWIPLFKFFYSYTTLHGLNEVNCNCCSLNNVRERRKSHMWSFYIRTRLTLNLIMLWIKLTGYSQLWNARCVRAFRNQSFDSAQFRNEYLYHTVNVSIDATWKSMEFYVDAIPRINFCLNPQTECCS